MTTHGLRSPLRWCGALLLFLAGCATPPGEIAPSLVPAADYRDLSCDDLQVALVDAGANLERASRRQRAKRVADGVGNALVIPSLLGNSVPLSGVLGILVRDSREAVARHKGEVVTVTKALEVRDCETAVGSALQPGPGS